MTERELATLAQACSEVRAAQERVESAVFAARAAGATWAQIGAATGTTRQAAHERWGHARRAGCPHTGCDCPEHSADGCPCGHGPGRGYRVARAG